MLSFLQLLNIITLFREFLKMPLIGLHVLVVRTRGKENQLLL